MDLTPDNDMTPTLTNPFENIEDEATVATDYQAAVARGEELQALPRSAATDRNILRQHSKNRMTVWERIEFLVDEEPTILCLLYTSPSPRDRTRSRMPSSA